MRYLCFVDDGEKLAGERDVGGDFVDDLRWDSGVAEHFGDHTLVHDAELVRASIGS